MSKPTGKCGMQDNESDSATLLSIAYNGTESKLPSKAAEWKTEKANEDTG